MPIFLRHAHGTSLFVIAALTLALFGPSAALGDDDESRFTFNAYLTQAYAETDGVPIFGIDEDGTFDYRTGALLVQFKVFDNDRLVLQLATEQLGNSVLDELRDDVEVDWLFYEHNFSWGTQLRVGRVPVPYGIYNEIRDVGTLLEFYRPPVGVYFEGAFSAESVDGVVVTQPIFNTSNWSLELDAYFGEWDRAEYIAPDVFDGTAENAHGIQLWLDTPVSGLRIGAAAQRFDQSGGWPLVRGPGETTRFDIALLSIDADFGRFFARAERQNLETSFGPFLGDAEIPAYYGLVGFRVTEKLQISAMYEHSWSDGDLFQLDPLYEDLAASLIYRFTPKFLGRIEYHQFETNSADVPTPIGQTSSEVDILILSASVAF